MSKHRIEIGPSIEKQNMQLAEAEHTKDKRRVKRYSGKDGGSAVVLPGKQFDTWRYETPSGELFEFSVRVVKESNKKGRGDKALGTEQTYFQVVIPDFTINEISSDVELLRQRVWKALEVPFEIEWKQYLLIELVAADHNLVYALWEEWGLPKMPQRHRETDYGVEDGPRLNGKFELKLVFEEWELGTTKEGRQVSRVVGKAGTRWEPDIRKGWPEVEMECGGWFGDRVKVLIPHTSSNEAAIVEVVRNLTMLKSRLQAICAPDSIEKNFAVAGCKMLSGSK